VHCYTILVTDSVREFSEYNASVHWAKERNGACLGTYSAAINQQTFIQWFYQQTLWAALNIFDNEEECHRSAHTSCLVSKWGEKYEKQPVSMDSLYKLLHLI
jgi:hypothetical protein